MYISRLIAEGFDTPEVVTDLPLTELEGLLSKHLAIWLYNHFSREYQKQKDSTEATASGVCDTGGAEYGGKTARQVKTGLGGKRLVVSAALPSSAASSSASASATVTNTAITTRNIKARIMPVPLATYISFPRYLADILWNKHLLYVLRTSLADTHDLRELIADPPIIFIDERQQFLFYRGIPIKLQPASFHYLLLLAEKPKQIVTRDEIYHCLWPGPMNYDGSNKPYDHQISDHKRRCISQIKKSIMGKIDMVPGELEKLIITRPKVGYMLSLGRERKLPCQVDN